MTNRSVEDTAIKLWSDEQGYHYTCKLCFHPSPGFKTRPRRAIAIVDHLASCKQFDRKD